MMVRTGCFMVAAALSAIGAGWQPARAQEALPPTKSLLFSPSEVTAITVAIREFERPKPTGSVIQENKDEPEVPNIFVSALAYYGPGDWTVWANGYRVTPGHQPSLFTVVSVSEDKAEVAIGGSKPAKFTLRPYQTWRSRTNDVVEGIVR